MIRIALLVGAILAAGAAQAADPGIRSQMAMTFGEAAYNISVNDDGKLTIACTQGCATPTRFEDNPAGTSIGLFRLTDNDNLLFTTWVSGSSYRTVIYTVDGARTRKVFDQYAIGAIDIIAMDPRGITLRAMQFASEKSRRAVVRAWRWNKRSGVFTRI